MITHLLKFFFLHYDKIILYDDAVLTPLLRCRYPVSCLRRTSSSTIVPCRFPFLRYRPCFLGALKLYNNNVSNCFIKFQYNSYFAVCVLLRMFCDLRFVVYYKCVNFRLLLLVLVSFFNVFCPFQFHILVTIIRVLLNLSFFFRL